MENQQTHKLFVCTTCATTWEAGKSVGISGGEELLAELVKNAETWNLKAQFTIQSVSCMSACNHACVVSFSALSKFTYLFGNLVYSDAIAILDCAAAYHAKSDGLLPWSERPELLKKGILAKIPMI